MPRSRCLRVEGNSVDHLREHPATGPSRKDDLARVARGRIWVAQFCGQFGRAAPEAHHDYLAYRRHFVKLDKKSRRYVKGKWRLGRLRRCRRVRPHPEYRCGAAPFC